VNAVIHCHPTASIAFGATGRVLRPISLEGTLFAPPDIPRFTLTGDLIHSKELGAALAKSLGESNAILMHNHGVAVVGETVGEAVMTAILLEQACEIQLRAEAGGGVQNWSGDQEALDKRARCWSPTQRERGWACLARSAPNSL
jgi:L-fuculose-phosphate aldolase